MVADKERNTCTGCTACVNVCPKSCISMKPDSQGFLYPYIEKELCIGCGACDRICEEASKKAESAEVCKGFGAIAKDKELQLCSSSGGVFTLLSNEVLSNGGAVAGVAFSEDNRTAFHKLAYSEEDVTQLRGAKYLQSNVGEIFHQVRELLKEGKEVLFSGTPCQVDGLKAFIGSHDDKLLCVDLVCHGAPSPLAWRKYCDEIEKNYQGPISSVNFRYKKFSWEKAHVEGANRGKVVFRSKNEDPFMRLFLSDYTLRPSCYECPHKGVDRKSDFTIADFWGVDAIAPGFSNGAGVSLVVIHTEKGLHCFEKIRDYLMIQEVDPQLSYTNNGAALRSAQRPERLDAFWLESESKSIEQLADKYAPVNETFKSKIKKSTIYGLMKKNKKVNMENGICFAINNHV